jgi:hypothetical protein
MNDTQLSLAIGMPTIAILVGVLINGMQYHAATAALNARMSTIETSINARLTSVETRLDILIGKMMDFDGRLSRLEERREKH